MKLTPRLPVTLTALFLLSGCMTGPTTYDDQPAAGKGYVDFFNDPDSTPVWLLYCTEGTREVKVGEEKVATWIQRVERPPGKHRFHLTLGIYHYGPAIESGAASSLLSEDAVVEVPVEEGKITPVRVFATETGVAPQGDPVRRGKTYSLKAEVQPVTDFKPRKQTQYSRRLRLL